MTEKDSVSKGPDFYSNNLAQNEINNNELKNYNESDRVTTTSESTYNHVDFKVRVALSDQPILTTVNLVLQTAFLKSCDKPISLLLIGRPGIGKTRLLSPMQSLDCVSYVNDITPKYLVEFLKKAGNKKKKFLVIPDFTSCLSHAKSTRTTLTAILRIMTEEGVSDLSDYHLEFKSDHPVKAGLITAITSSSYNQFKENWKKTGFLSRLLPFSFNHSISTTNRIRAEIDSNKSDQLDKVKFTINKRPKPVAAPQHLLRQLWICQDLLAKSTDSAPYRHQIQLKSIAESVATVRGHTEITQNDIDTVIWLSKWINYDAREI